MALAIIPSIVFQYTLPREASGQKNTRLQISSVLISISLAIIVILFSPALSNMFFPKFVDAVNIIQIMSLAIIPISISSIFSAKFLAIEKSKYLIIGSSIFLIIQISMILLLGDIYGIVGIASAIIFASIAEAVFLTTMYKLKMKTRE